MSTSSSSTIPKVRTYAGDLNFVRSHNQGNSSAKTSPVDIPATKKSEEAIPPFHSFAHNHNEQVSKKPALATTTASQIETQKILTKSSALSSLQNNQESLPAVIITDTKHKRFGIGSALTTSITNWWKNKQVDAKKKKTPRYTVPEAERRKGVIQKATAKTGRTMSADHNAVVSRIKATKQVPRTEITTQANIQPTVPPTIPKDVPVGISNPRVQLRQNYPQTETIADHSEVTTPNWESDIQSKANALTTIKPASAIVLTGKEFSKIKQQRAYITQTVTPDTAKKILPTIPPKIQDLETPTTEPDTNTEKVSFDAVSEYAAKPTPVVPPIPVSLPKILPVIPTKDTVKTADLAIPPVEPFVEGSDIKTSVTLPEKKTERRFAPPRESRFSIFTQLSQTNHIVFIAFGLLVFIGAAGLGINAYFKTNATDTNVTVDTPPQGTTVNSSNIATYVISSETDIVTAFATIASSSEPFVEIRFTNQQGEKITASELFTILGAKIVFDFKASISDSTFGTYRGTPWIHLTVSDKNSAFGGMLTWEDTLYRDLEAFFTSEQDLSRQPFLDTILDSTDVRVLKNSVGEEEMLYGFVDYDSLLITNDSTTFVNMAERIQAIQ